MPVRAKLPANVTVAESPAPAATGTFMLIHTGRSYEFTPVNSDIVKIRFTHGRHARA